MPKKKPTEILECRFDYISEYTRVSLVGDEGFIETEVDGLIYSDPIDKWQVEVLMENPITKMRMIYNDFYIDIYEDGMYLNVVGSEDEIERIHNWVLENLFVEIKLADEYKMYKERL